MVNVKNAYDSMYVYRYKSSYVVVSAGSNIFVKTGKKPFDKLQKKLFEQAFFSGAPPKNSDRCKKTGLTDVKLQE